MDKFAWILEAPVFRHLASNGGVSSAYIIPKARAPENPAALAGTYLLIILRGSHGDQAFASLFVRKVEQFEDGLNKGDMLLTVDPAKSFRFVKSYDSTTSISTAEKTGAFALGVQQISDAIFDWVIEKVRKSIVVKLQLPPATMLAAVKEQGTAKINDVAVRKMIGAFTSRFALEELWAAGSKPKLPPFGNFSYRKIEDLFGKEIADGASTLLTTMDPTIVVVEDAADLAKRKPMIRGLEPIIDINLQPIDPDRVYARKFVAGAQTQMNLADSLEKTEHAEKRHQDMLRDIVIRLRDLKYSPMQSSSIDLFLEIENQCTTFELKTSNATNILSQSAKGIFQLGCYNLALTELGYQRNRLVLILEKTSEKSLDVYVSQILNFFGIKPLFYDLSQPWPSRLEGFDELLTSGV